MKSYIVGLALALTVSVISVEQPIIELRNTEYVDIKYDKLVLSVPSERKLARRKYTKPSTKDATGVKLSVINGDLHGKDYIYFKESGNVACKINGGAIDCNYDGDRACGIGQSLPCQKLTSQCKLSDYNCQDRWFSNYAKQRYGSWAKAEQFHRANNWW